jgi:hypothetical protein
MKNNKAAAEDGLVAEMLKAGCEPLSVAIAAIFSDLLCNRTMPPNEWKRSRLSVIFKNGDYKLPKNYRLISIMPVLAKLYSMILLARIKNALESTQIDTQYGNRKGRGCSDAVHVLRMVAEKSAEWGETLRYAAVDVEKAFDRVHHLKILQALAKEDLDDDMVAAIRHMYMELRGFVQLWPGACSREFVVGRGVRQGDPLSPILFGLVMKIILKKTGFRMAAVWLWHQRWTRYANRAPLNACCVRRRRHYSDKELEDNERDANRSAAGVGDVWFVAPPDQM